MLSIVTNIYYKEFPGAYKMFANKQTQKLL